MPVASSPNHSPRKAPPRVIVLHATGRGTLKGILEWVTIPASKVSYHGLIAATGEYYAIVPPERAAWHCGVSEWNGTTAVNSCSLGLAFVNPNDGVTPLTPQQMAMARKVVRHWAGVFPIEDVTTHAAIARPHGRKTDPLAVPNFALTDYWPLTP